MFDPEDELTKSLLIGGICCASLAAWRMMSVGQAAAAVRCDGNRQWSNIEGLEVMPK
jgi:hypothetical protein